jgi:hypothetical protein
MRFVLRSSLRAAQLAERLDDADEVAVALPPGER